MPHLLKLLEQLLEIRILSSNSKACCPSADQILSFPRRS